MSLEDAQVEKAPRERTLAERYGEACQDTNIAQMKRDRAKNDLDAAQKAYEAANAAEVALWDELVRERSERLR